MWLLGSDDSTRLHTTVGAGQCQKWRATGYGSHPKLPQTTQSTSGVRPHEWWTSPWVCASVVFFAFHFFQFQLSLFLSRSSSSELWQFFDFFNVLRKTVLLFWFLSFCFWLKHFTFF